MQPRDGRRAAASRITLLAAAVDTEPGGCTQPVLTEAEAMAVVGLLDDYARYVECPETVDLASTLIVRVLDRLGTSDVIEVD